MSELIERGEMSPYLHLADTEVDVWIEEVRGALLQHGFSLDAASVWLNTPHTELSGKTPIDAISCRRHRKVYELIAKAAVPSVTEADGAKEISKRGDMKEYSLLFHALSFAARKHSKQRRKDADASPYINHPIEVAKLLADTAGVTDPEILAAAVLHDTVEDTETTADELRQEFGERIAALVLEMTDDKSLPKARRKELQIENAAHKSNDACLLKLADKIANVRDVMENPPADWSEERKAEYLRWAWEVVERLPVREEGLMRELELLSERGRGE